MEVQKLTGNDPIKCSKDKTGVVNVGITTDTSTSELNSSVQAIPIKCSRDKTGVVNVIEKPSF